MVRQNLHCHTTFDDGNDSPETMVRAAEKAGLRSVGVSLHCPIPGEESWCCRDSDEIAFIDEMHRLGGCHIGVLPRFMKDPDNAARLIAYHGGADRAAQRYYERVSSLSDFPEISIVGHFDLPTKFNERERLYDVASPVYRDAAFAAMEKLNAADKIFEINSGAISRGWRTAPYPSEELLRHLNSLGGRILISSDAHSADAMTCAFDRCEALAKSCGFTELWQFTGSGFEAVGI